MRPRDLPRGGPDRRGSGARMSCFPKYPFHPQAEERPAPVGAMARTSHEVVLGRLAGRVGFPRESLWLPSPGWPRSVVMAFCLQPWERHLKMSGTVPEASCHTGGVRCSPWPLRHWTRGPAERRCWEASGLLRGTQQRKTHPGTRQVLAQQHLKLWEQELRAQSRAWLPLASHSLHSPSLGRALPGHWSPGTDSDL